MTRLFEVTLEIDRVVAERGFRFRACGRKRFGKRGFVARDLHAASAAAGCRLHEQRETDFPADAHGFFIGRHAAFGAGHDRNAEALRGALGLDLVAHDADVLGLGADKADAVLGENFREARILG